MANDRVKNKVLRLRHFHDSYTQVDKTRMGADGVDEEAPEQLFRRRLGEIFTAGMQEHFMVRVEESIARRTWKAEEIEQRCTPQSEGTNNDPSEETSHGCRDESAVRACRHS